MGEELKIAVVFTVQVETAGEDENVLLAGETRELGKWCLHKGILLDRVSMDSSSGTSEWRTRVQVPANTNFQYRYVIVESCNPPSIEKLVVKRWEGLRISRTGSTKIQSEKCVKNQDGLHEVQLETDRFGFNGDEENMVERGFLTCQTEVHLRFHNAVEFPLVLFGKEAPNQFNVTVKQFDSQTIHKTKDSCKSSDIIAKKLTDFRYQEFRDHRENECNFSDGEYVDFTTQILNFEKLVLEITVKSVPVDSCSSLVIGQTIVVSSQLQGSIGTFVAPLTRNMIPIGHLLVDYLVVKPFEHPSVLDMEHSPAAYWNAKNAPIFIGHRGLGCSFRCERPAYLTENTIGSFVRAHEVGADYVEFDVLLTKDGVPVVYHDFDTDVLVGKKGSNSEVIKMEVKDLTLKQLESLKSPDQDKNVSVDGEISTSSSGVLPSDKAFKSKIFPTLQEVFHHTPLPLHFDIELKYPVYYMDDVENREAGSIDMNKYVDTVLQTVFDNARDRNLLFSCFDPDVCTMLRLKQHRYPVMLLTCGINSVWTMYKDVRSRSVAMGTSFVLSEGIIGLGMFSTPLLKDPWKVQKAREAEVQVMFTWGDENNEAKTRQRLREMGLDGIMCDRIYEANLEPPEKRQKKRLKHYDIDKDVVLMEFSSL